ncbi:MAG: thioredoxin, partial [Alphaproteobacteria bacterium]|nr:thioredoxin [Alphaproteobacteria bacterium]
ASMFLANTPAGPDVVREYDGADDAAALQTLLAQESQDKFIMVMFHAPWCPYCKNLTTQFRTAAPETTVSFDVLKIDVEKFPVLVNSYMQGDGVPETHVYLHGQNVDGFGGVAPDIRTIVDYIDGLSRYADAPVTKPYISAPSAFPKAH